MAIRRTLEEIHRNKELALARRALLQLLEPSSKEGIRNLFESFERAETSVVRTSARE